MNIFEAMRLDETQADQIRGAFAQMQSRYDFLDLLNMVKSLIYGKKTTPFELKQLTWHANPTLGVDRYSQFSIRKKSGGERKIHSPVKGLKAIQRTLSVILQCVYHPHQAAMGFVWGRSIVDNARFHTGQRYVFNVDLKDFFPSIDQARVWKCMQLNPFKLDKESSNQLRFFRWEDFKANFSFTEEDVSFWRLKGHIFAKTPIGELHVARGYNDEEERYVLKGIDRILSPEQGDGQGSLWLVNKIPESGRLQIANMIASLCCTRLEVDRKNKKGEWEKGSRNVLPQGAPTSPVLTNVICQRLDHLLTGVARRFGLRYSRYADDITFSSNHNVYQENGEFRRELERIIEEQGFQLNVTKTRLQKDGHRKEVTGLLVNEKPNVQKRYLKQLRMWLYYWERYGESKTNEWFSTQYVKDRGHVKKRVPELRNVISGKLDYLQMVKGPDDESYVRLKERFSALTGDEHDEKKIFSSIKPSDKKGMFSRPTETIKDNLVFVITEDGIDKTTDRQKPKSNRRVKSLEEFMVESIKINENPEQAESSVPRIHRPKELVQLLRRFSINDSALKYSTHSWDAGRDVDMFKDLGHFLAKVKQEYGEFSMKLSNLKYPLNGKIFGFLLNEEVEKSGWGDKDPKKRIYFGWSSPELREACITDTSLNPEDFILPDKYQIIRGGKTIQRFKHVIDVFKNEIEIRDENSALLNLLLGKHRNRLYSFPDPAIENLENKTFYTDVSTLSKALDLIFDNIQKRPHHAKVGYSVRNKDNESYVLEITQYDSFNTGKSINDERFRLEKGDFGDIANQLTNLCDWSIESLFEEGSYRINLLVSDPMVPHHEKLDKVDGFKYLLTFYK